MLSRPLAVAVLAAAFVLAASGSAGAGPLAEYRWKNRVLVVTALRPQEPKLAQQRAVFAAMRAGAAERDLVLIVAVGDEPAARAIRQALGLGADAFRAVLVGKDGGVKLSADTPLGPDQLFPLIDTMPMRRDEMDRKP